MTTTRISHTGHNHPNTTAARTACRKAIKATPVVTMVRGIRVGNGKAIHLATAMGTRCGAGYDLDNANLEFDIALVDITCKSCINKYGHAHG